MVEAKGTSESARLELKSEYSWFVSVAGAIAASALFFGSMCVARGAHFEALCGLAAAALTVLFLAAWFTSKRVVFEHDGNVLRGYHERFGRRSEQLELREVRDIGFVVEGDRAASSVVAILDLGEMQKIDSHFFHVHTTYDEQLKTLRNWFLARRYAGAVPAELGNHPPFETR